jgi:cysteine desulfurase
LFRQIPFAILETMKKLKREVYLDNAAATPVDPAVLKAMKPYWNISYGNPSSFNDAGRAAKAAIEVSRTSIALVLGAKPREIVFTSSASEANTMAIMGAAQKICEVRGKLHFITSVIEHKSVLEPFRRLEQEGHRVTYLSVNRYGTVAPENLAKALTYRTALVSIIYANNEIGTVEPIKRLAKTIKEFRNRKSTVFPYFHIDAAQAAGYLDINVNNLGIDLMTLNAAKIYGPKGVGLLYVRGGTALQPLILGGEQEHGLRAGTEAVPLIVGFAKALELAQRNKNATGKHDMFLRDYFIEQLRKVLPDAVLNGPDPKNRKTKERLPNNVNISIPGMESEQLLLYLDKTGIRASSGSACTSHELEASHVLKAIGLPDKVARGSLRFSLGVHTSKADIDYTVRMLRGIIEKLKRLYPASIRKLYYAR